MLHGRPRRSAPGRRASGGTLIPLAAGVISRLELGSTAPPTGDQHAADHQQRDVGPCRSRSISHPDDRRREHHRQLEGAGGERVGATAQPVGREVVGHRRHGRLQERLAEREDRGARGDQQGRAQGAGDQSRRRPSAARRTPRSAPSPPSPGCGAVPSMRWSTTSWSTTITRVLQANAMPSPWVETSLTNARVGGHAGVELGVGDERGDEREQGEGRDAGQPQHLAVAGRGAARRRSCSGRPAMWRSGTSSRNSDGRKVRASTR